MAEKKITRGVMLEGLERSVKGRGGDGIFSALFNDTIDNMDMDKLAKDLEKFAKSGHKKTAGRHYENDTGDLESATYGYAQDGDIYIGVNEDETVHRGYNYTPWILYGKRGNWTGDDFLQETVDHNDQIIFNAYQSALNEAVDKTNNAHSSMFWLLQAGRLITKVTGIFRKVKRFFRRL
jgi:hypothetical protein